MNLKNVNYGIIVILFIMFISSKNITYFFLMIPFIQGALLKLYKNNLENTL